MSKYLLFEIAEDGSTVHGAFFNGELPIRSTAGRFEDGALFLAFDQYAARIEATYADGRLEGQYVRGSRNPYPFRAQTAVETDGASGEVPPSIDGVWTIPTESNKGEKPGGSSFDRRVLRCPARFCGSTAIPAISPDRIATARSS